MNDDIKPILSEEEQKPQKEKKEKKDKKPNRFVRALKTIFADNILITLLSVTLAVALCIITAAMA